MRKKVAVSVAHHPASPGACYIDNTEHAESTIWSDLVEKYLRKRGIEVYRAPVGGLITKVNAINKQYCDLAIEIHFNSSASGKASGCETLYCPGSVAGRAAASTIQRMLVTTMGNKDRGIKEGWYRMEAGSVVDYFLRKTNCPALILEPEFIQQWGSLTDRRGSGTKVIAEAIAKVLGIEED
ncbi:MAG: N-acetylmuramoyl-L-alanine amidase [Zetaproteobacteria bacterium]|nr:N-acetylmuramoyl-L-alanine amidase [Zetaproteobacteria bacterium]